MAASKRDKQALKTWAAARKEGRVVDMKETRPVTQAGKRAGWGKDGPGKTGTGVAAYAASRNAKLASEAAKDPASHMEAAKLHREAAEAHTARGENGSADVSYHEDEAKKHDDIARDEKGQFAKK